jgi:hypothetical protein
MTARYPAVPQRIAFYTAALRNMQSAADVQAVSISTALPVLANHGAPFLFEGQPAVALGQRPVGFIESIRPGYPRVTGVPIVAGRAFTDRDDAEAPPVALGIRWAPPSR